MGILRRGRGRIKYDTFLQVNSCGLKCQWSKLQLLPKVLTYTNVRSKLLLHPTDQQDQYLHSCY